MSSRVWILPMPADPDFPRLAPVVQAYQLYGVNKALGHIGYAEIALHGLGGWADEALAKLHDAETELTQYRDRELVS